MGEVEDSLNSKSLRDDLNLERELRFKIESSNLCWLLANCSCNARDEGRFPYLAIKF